MIYLDFKKAPNFRGFLSMVLIPDIFCPEHDIVPVLLVFCSLYLKFSSYFMASFANYKGAVVA